MDRKTTDAPLFIDLIPTYPPKEKPAPKPPKAAPLHERIIERVARDRGVPVERLKQSGKDVDGVTKARQLVYFLLKHHTRATCRQIGEWMGDKHNTRVWRGIEAVEECLNDPQKTEELRRYMDKTDW